MLALALLATASANAVLPNPARLFGRFAQNPLVQKVAEQMPANLQGMASETPALLPEFPCMATPPMTVTENDLSFCTAFNGVESCCSSAVDTYYESQMALPLAIVGMSSYMMSCYLSIASAAVVSGRCMYNGANVACSCLPQAALEPGSTGHICLTSCDVDESIICATKTGTTYSDCVADSGSSSAASGSMGMPISSSGSGSSSSSFVCPDPFAAQAEACSNLAVEIFSGQSCGSFCDPGMQGSGADALCANTCAELSEACFAPFIDAIGCSAEEFSCILGDDSNSGGSNMCYDHSLGMYRDIDDVPAESQTPDSAAAFVPSMVVLATLLAAALF